MSNSNDCCCKYDVSRFTLSGIGSSSRPLTCAQPVSPGLRLCTPCCVRRAIRSCWLNSAGRGPTKLMLPTKMLHNWGSSSRLLLRKKDPIGVRCDLASASKCVATAGVPSRMLRNLGILKILLCRPTRSDQYKAGPGEVKRTAKKTSNIGTAKTMQATNASSKSNNRFTTVTFSCFLQTLIERQRRTPSQQVTCFSNIYLQ